MFRSLSRDRRGQRGPRRAALAFVLGLVACSSIAEWEEVPGTLELYADPLPPVTGQPLVLGVRATNVGPVDVYQGSVRVATFANLDLSERVDVEVVAASDETPRAVAVAYDRKRLEKDAAQFNGEPMVPDAGTGDAGPTFQESCPGLIDPVSQGDCSDTTGSAPVAVRIWNNSESPVSVYERAPAGSPGMCFNNIVALAAPGDIVEIAAVEYQVLSAINDANLQVMRAVRLPPVGQCDLVLVP